MPVPSGYGVPTLDFIGCYKGFFFAIETKAPGKEPTPRQRKTIKDIGANGTAIWSSSWEWLEPELTKMFANFDEQFAIMLAASMKT